MQIKFDGPAREWQNSWADVAGKLATSDVPAVDLALRQGFVLTHEQARSAGCSNADLRRLVYRREWSVPRRGVISVLPPGDGSLPGGTRIEVLAAAAALVRPGAVISHTSAASAFGLPFFGRSRRPELTSGHVPGTADRGGARVYAAKVRPTEIHRWFGAPITSPARTVADLARHGRRTGLMTAEAALHERLVCREQLLRAVELARGWPGVRKARAIIDFASEDVESALESLTRLLLHDSSVPIPEPQRWVFTAHGWYRVDGLWAARKVVLECDGLVKYRDHDDALSLEKKRQEALERAGFRVVRVTWDDVVNNPVETIARILAALRRGGRGVPYCSL
ncbi:MAG TPA: DUF559 domain-containing protein [Jatrophihabitans sp.]|jgi:very-short-patch-repair endonuclease